MRTTILTSIFLTVAAVHATVAFPRSTLNGACTGAGGAPGVCVHTSACDQNGGTYISNACPGTPEDVKCCTKPKCGIEDKQGDCRWTQNCAAGKTVIKNLCPGPDGFTCCADATPNNTKPTPQPTPQARPQVENKAKNLGEKILAKAETKAGLPYHWGGGSCKGPTGGGFDCSGLVSWAVCQVTGRNLFAEGLRVTRSMYCASEEKLKYKKIKFANRRAGDAVFFGGKCDCKNNPEGIHHVGLMTNSGWDMFNALKTGTKLRHDNFKNWSEKPCDHVIRFV